MELQKFITNYQSDIIVKPYIIAEAGVNHEGSMSLAKRLIDEAAEGGADAIKFQTYKAETLASKNSPAYWDTSQESAKSQYSLFKKYDKFWKKEFEQLKHYCDQTSIEFLSTPFDIESANFLNDLMPVFKVSSSDITNFPFIEHICQFGKPVLLSTGASYLWEIQQAVELIESYQNKLCLMHCVLNYPTEDKNANIGMIKDIIRKFPDHIPGYSDHTLPGNMDNLTTATLLGAAIIEKHFTHDKSLPGNDHYHAMNKTDLQIFNQKTSHIFETLGSFKLTAIESEKKSRLNARRSLVAVKDIPAGKTVEKSDFTWKRPATGISPKYLKEVIGKKTTQFIQKDSSIKWNDLTE